MAMDGSGRVRIIDIAKRVGVSSASVTKVLSGGLPSIRVCREKADMIRAAAKEMHYRPNLIAKTLVGGKSHLIGAFIDSYASDTYFEILSSLYIELRRHGYNLLIREGHDSISDIIDAYHTFVQYGVDGMIILSHNYINLNGDSLSLPNINRVMFLEKPNIEGACYVDIDFVGAIENGVKHLIQTGRKRLGLIIPDIKSSTIITRRQGFERGVATAADRLECGLVHVSGSFMPSLEEFEQQYHEFIAPNRLDGLLLLEDNRAAGMVRTCRNHGMRIPEDIALIGFGNTLFSRFMNPSLTTFGIDTVQCGGELVRLILQLIDDISPSAIPPSVILPQIIVRESTVGHN